MEEIKQSFLQRLARNRGFWYLASIGPLAAAGRAVNSRFGKGAFYWCAGSLAYVGSAYLLSSHHLLFKSPSGRVPNALKILLFPFFLASNIFNWQARLRDSTPAFQEIKPGLFLGRRLLPTDRDALRKAGIDAILDVTAEFDALKLTALGEDIAYLNISVLDHGVPSLANLHKGVLWIDEQLESGRKILVHCALGRGRSATACLAYLIYREPDRALPSLVTEVKQARPTIAPNRLQMRTLSRYRSSTLLRDAHAAVDLIVNPTGGGGNHSADVHFLREMLEPHFRLRLLEMGPDQNGADLARKSLVRGVKSILVAGGDGTVSSVASQIAGTNVALGVIPLGTANAIATCLYGTGILTNGIEHACREILGGKARKIDVARANDRIMVLMAGVGFESMMVEAAEGARKKQWGAAGYLVSGLEALRNAPALRVSLTVDGEEKCFESFGVSVANMAPFFSISAQGGGAPASRDGLLDVTSIHSDASTTSRALSMLELIRAGLTDSPAGEGISHTQGRDILLETDPPATVVVDGELCLQTPVRFHVWPAALKVIFGPESGRF